MTKVFEDLSAYEKKKQGMVSLNPVPYKSNASPMTYGYESVNLYRPLALKTAVANQKFSKGSEVWNFFVLFARNKIDPCYSHICFCVIGS